MRLTTRGVVLLLLTVGLVVLESPASAGSPTTWRTARRMSGRSSRAGRSRASGGRTPRARLRITTAWPSGTGRDRPSSSPRISVKAAQYAQTAAAQGHPGPRDSWASSTRRAMASSRTRLPRSDGGRRPPPRVTPTASTRSPRRTTTARVCRSTRTRRSDSIASPLTAAAWKRGRRWPPATSRRRRSRDSRTSTRACACTRRPARRRREGLPARGRAGQCARPASDRLPVQLRRGRPRQRGGGREVVPPRGRARRRRAESNLGGMYEDGKGVPEDWVEAAQVVPHECRAGQCEWPVPPRPGVSVRHRRAPEPQARHRVVPEGRFPGQRPGARTSPSTCCSRGNFVGFRNEQEEAAVIAGKLRTGSSAEEPGRDAVPQLGRATRLYQEPRATGSTATRRTRPGYCARTSTTSASAGASNPTARIPGRAPVSPGTPGRAPRAYRWARRRLVC